MLPHPDPKQFIGTIIFPISISTPFAVGDVYCYLVKDEKVVLIDCGHKEEQAFVKIENVFKEKGLIVRDLDEIWLTHGHPDHFGLAAQFADESGADVLGHPGEQANFAGNDDRELFADFFEYHSIPEALTKMMVDQLDWLQQYQEPIEPEWIKGGERLTSGQLNFIVQHTPGHAPGHIVFREESGLMFGGDLLLQHISTNALINFDPDTGARNRSLLQYRNSLQWIQKQKGYLLPGHGAFIDRIGAVAAHHLGEHEKRYREIIKLLGQQPYSLFELAKKMFPEPMAEGAVFLVLSEVMGYLDWGVRDGMIEEVGKTQVRFRSTE